MRSAAERTQLIEVLRTFPDVLTQKVSGLSPAQLMTHSLPNEWTVQQIVHHLADSHMNSVIRLKLILTTDRPTLQGYDQEAWAELYDVSQVPIDASLAILRGLHARWCALWDNLTEEQWQRVGIHSVDGPQTPDDIIGIYADHCHNHLEQIRRVIAALP